MTSTNDFDRLVGSWLETAGPSDIGTATVATALEAARRTSQRRGPMAWLAGPTAWPQARRRATSLGDLPPALRLTLVVGLLALAVAALALLGVGSSPAPSPGPNPTQPGVVVAPPAPSPTPPVGAFPCQSGVGFVGDAAASTGPLPSALPSGGAPTLLVTLATGSGRYEIATLDPTRADATPERLIGIGGPGHALVPSPDGRAFAIGANATAGFPCAEPVVVSRSGDWYTSPFRVNRVGVVRHLAWSRDGGILYGIHTSNPDGAVAGLPIDQGSVWAWDSRTDTVERLGSPCTGCQLGDPAAGPDGTLAVAFQGPGCPNDPGDPVRLECGVSGVAVLGQDGWRTVTTSGQLLAAAPNSLNLALLGWSDASTLVLGSPTTGVTRVRLDGTVTPVGFGGECCGGSGGWLVLSPDGTTAALSIKPGDYVHDEILLAPVDGGPARIVGTVVHADGYLEQPAWSSDGRTIATLRTATTESGNSSTVSFSVLVVPTDGSATRQYTLPIDSNDPSAIAWLPPAR